MSVSEVSVWPRSSSPSRSSRKFSMIPLWMTVISPVQSRWGWALRSLGRPWVAQRVWARPIAACGVRSAMAVWRLASLPARFSTNRSAAVVDEGDPRRVVAAVLEALEALDQDRAGLAGTRVADDAAHEWRFSVALVAPVRPAPEPG